MANQGELIAQFIEISGSDENVAQFYLSSSDWSLEDALSNYLATQADDQESLRSMGVLASGALPHGLSEYKSSTRSDSFNKSLAAKPKFATLKDMNKRNEAEDSDEGQAFYAGGSDRSGQQVLGPPKRKNFREQLTEMFRMAQENINIQDSINTPSTSAASNNWGQGIRLGMTDNDHSVVEAAKKDGEKKRIVVLKLWSEGFSIDDGELRSYDNPKNKEFLATVMRGDLPQEFIDMGWEITADIEDHRNEEYKNPETVTKTFKGSGRALGSPAPNVIENAVNISNTKTEAANDHGAKEKLNLNTSEPTTNIQIRLADGTRLTAQFNLNHTIGDIEDYIQTARPQYANQNFVLVTSFPTRELTDVNITIESAGLKNAALMQRLK